MVSDSRNRPQAQLYPFNVQQPVPTFWLPLEPENGRVAIALKPLLDQIYELSGYDLDIGYSQDPTPKWSSSDLVWIDQRF